MAQDVEKPNQTASSLWGLRVAHLVAWSSIAWLLSSCATYEPKPLPSAPAVKESLGALGPAWGSPQRPLTIAELSVLAVRNNPDLVAARTQIDVADAQLIQAGILPNPSVNANYGFFLGGAGFINSISAALTQDIKSLVLLSSKKQIAATGVRQVNASMIWQEWQTIGKARLAAVDLIQGKKARNALLDAAHLAADRAGRDRLALQRGDATLVTVTPDLVAASDLQKQLADADRLLETRKHDLNALLGFAPDTQLQLVDTPDLPPIDLTKARNGVADLAQRRPDLIALQLGYQAQEEKLSGAILAQFPAMVFGGTGGRDTSDARTAGPDITMDLPIFDRNQGNIAIEKATRAQLHAEYAARLIAATGEAAAMISDVRLLTVQLQHARDENRDITASADKARTAFLGGYLDDRTYVDLTLGSVAKQQEIIALEQSLFEQNAALATLLGVGMPKMTIFQGRAS